MATMMTIEPSLSVRPGRGHLGQRNLSPDRDAVDVKVAAPAVVGLDEDPDGPAAAVLRQHSRRGADSAFELVADHPGAAADAALGDRSARGGVARLEHVLRLDVEPVHVVQPEIAGFGHDRQAPGHRAAGPPRARAS